LRELKYALVQTLSTIVNIRVDIEECGPDGTFSDPDPDGRKAALDAVKEWVDVAHNLGVKSVLVGPGKVDPENLAPTTEAYGALATYALSKGVHVMVENRTGFGSANPEELVKLMKLAGPGRITTSPDFGNFPDESTREKGLKMLFPYAPTVCHVTGLEFDSNGVETGYDFSQSMETAKRSGFHGIYTIEFAGPGDPYAGIQRTLDELLKYL
jgi:sugar phosphate isomerase/epimerase